MLKHVVSALAGQPTVEFNRNKEFKTIQYSTCNPEHRRSQVLVASHPPSESQLTKLSHQPSPIPQFQDIHQLKHIKYSILLELQN